MEKFSKTLPEFENTEEWNGIRRQEDGIFALLGFLCSVELSFRNNISGQPVGPS